MELHKSSFTIHEKNYNIMAVDLDNSLYVWVGDESQICTELHGGFPLKNIKGEESVVTTMMGDVDSISGDIAKSLAHRLGKAVFMSAHIQETDSETLSIYQENVFNAVLKIFT